MQYRVQEMGSDRYCTAVQRRWWALLGCSDSESDESPCKRGRNAGRTDFNESTPEGTLHGPCSYWYSANMCTAPVWTQTKRTSIAWYINIMPSSLVYGSLGQTANCILIETRKAYSDATRRLHVSAVRMNGSGKHWNAVQTTSLTRRSVMLMTRSGVWLVSQDVFRSRYNRRFLLFRPNFSKWFPFRI